MPDVVAALRGEADLARAEADLTDAIRAVLAITLAQVRRAVLGLALPAWAGTKAPAVSHAGAPVLDAMDSARPIWRAGLETYAKPVVDHLFAGRQRRSLTAAVADGRSQALAEVVNRLSAAYWADTTERLDASIDEIFDAVRVELDTGLDRGESIGELRDRIIRVLDLDAFTRVTRDKIKAVEGLLANPHLDAAGRDKLLARRERILDRLFDHDGAVAVAKAKRRLARALATEDPARAQLLRDEADALSPAPGRRQKILADLGRVDDQLYRNPDLEAHEVATLQATRAELYTQAHAQEQTYAHKAERIARTEALSAMNAATLITAKATEQTSGVRLAKRWFHTTDERVRPTHKAMGDELIPLDAAFMVGGFPAMFPGDPTLPPAESVQCRCTLIIEDVDDDLQAAAFAPNWVDQCGGLPKYIKRVARHIQANGRSKSESIAAAINFAKHLCATGDVANWPGTQNVNPGSRAEACTAVSQWNALKACARARRG